MEFQEIIVNNISAIVTGLCAIFGTVIGTLIGWLLNDISKKGKLKLINSKTMIDQNSSNTFSFQVDLLIYNSADNIKSINNIEIEIFANSGKYLYNWIDTNGETLEHYNFQPKQITKLTTNFLKTFDQNILKGDFDEIKFKFREKRKNNNFTVYKNNLYAFFYYSNVTLFLKRLKGKLLRK